MRERHQMFRSIGVSTRITPAYAGKTVRFVGGWEADQGSPPRMRERLRFLIQSATPSRITPAYAGKTKIKKDRDKLSQDHPRVCGKDSLPYKAMFQC